MNLLSPTITRRTAACAENPALFAAAALDYDPRDDTYSHLSAEEHAERVILKTKAEEAAVDVCFGCPLMLACEEEDAKNLKDPISGVVGGRTEAERKARRDGRSLTADTKVTSVPNPQIAPGDRGPRNQVDDALVASLSKAGMTSEQIAREMNCSPRTISRSRRRIAAAEAKAAAAAAAENVTSEAETMVVERAENTTASLRPAPETNKTNADVAEIFSGSSAAATAARTAAAVQNAPQHAPSATRSPKPFENGRKVKPFTAAIYDYLVSVGGSADRETLQEIGAPYISDEAAIARWFSSNSKKNNDGVKELRSTKVGTPRAEQIHVGARLAVFNALEASAREKCRTREPYMDREGDVFTLKPHVREEWAQRTEALNAMNADTSVSAS